MVEAPAAFIWDYYERRKGEWRRELVCPVYVNEIATVEHFAPGRKKVQRVCIYTTRGVYEWRRYRHVLYRDYSHLLALAELLYVD